MEQFKIEVIKTDEFLVKVDPGVWNEETRKEWSNTFWNVDSTEDVAKSLAEAVSRKGLEEYYEGFGRVKTFFSDGTLRAQFKHNDEGVFQILTDEQYCKGVSITVLSMDDDIETNLID